MATISAICCIGKIEAEYLELMYPPCLSLIQQTQLLGPRQFAEVEFFADHHNWLLARIIDFAEPIIEMPMRLLASIPPMPIHAVWYLSGRLATVPDILRVGFGQSVDSTNHTPYLARYV